MGIIGQSDQQIAGKWFRFTVFDYGTGSTTFETDPSAMCQGTAAVKVFHLEGGTDPTAAVAATSSVKSTVTVSGGTAGRVLVITVHGTSTGGVH